MRLVNCPCVATGHICSYDPTSIVIEFFFLLFSLSIPPFLSSVRLLIPACIRTISSRSSSMKVCKSNLQTTFLHTTHTIYQRWATNWELKSKVHVFKCKSCRYTYLHPEVGIWNTKRDSSGYIHHVDLNTTLCYPLQAHQSYTKIWPNIKLPTEEIRFSSLLSNCNDLSYTIEHIFFGITINICFCKNSLP